MTDDEKTPDQLRAEAEALLKHADALETSGRERVMAAVDAVWNEPDPLVVKLQDGRRSRVSTTTLRSTGLPLNMVCASSGQRSPIRCACWAAASCILGGYRQIRDRLAALPASYLTQGFFSPIKKGT
jgi:hypothetical protein